MSLPIHVALVPHQVNLSSPELTRVAAALSKQVHKDFSPIWKVDATVDAFARLQDVPPDYWPLIVVADVKGAAGYHQDKHGQPYSLIEFSADWSMTASHECLEMLADPFGRRLRSANLLDQAVKLGMPQRRVRYIVEVCDPSESGAAGYQVNGVLVSDFYTPNFFDPVAVSGVRYSFTGKVTAPRQVLKDGYISWHDPVDGHWYQLRMFADEFSTKKPHVVDLTKQTLFESFIAREGLRGASDRVTRPPSYREGLTGPARSTAARLMKAVDQAHAAHSRSLTETVSEMLASAKKLKR
jgi:hypothetical protein